MIRMLLELGYHKNYDINRALLEAVQCKSNTVHDDGHDEATRSEIISLLIDAGANPHSAVAITQFPDKHLVHGFSSLRGRGCSSNDAQLFLSVSFIIKKFKEM